MSGKGDKLRTKKYKQYRDNFDVIKWHTEVEAGPGDVIWTTKKGIKKKVYGRGSR